MKERATRRLEAARPELLELSHWLSAHPELCFEEHQSAEALTSFLERRGFEVTCPVADLDTAFVATAGSGDLHVGICAEYDALPGVGHACGHNMIAASAVGAGLALAELADDLGITVRVLGTPAEEGGGGKVLMLERGAFDGLHAAMMVHPAPFEGMERTFLAISHINVRYRGRSAHASAYPEIGVNAADALTVAQVAIGLIRQHVPPTTRIHGIVRDGGDAPNIVPERTSGEWLIRAPTLAELEEILPKVHACFEAGAVATGAELEIVPAGPPYSEMRHDPDLVRLYRANAETLGRVDEHVDPSLTGSTDMANVSLVIPTIHPMIKIDSNGAVNHQAEFAQACVSPSADQAVIDGAVAMAWTVIDAATTDSVRSQLLARTYSAASEGVPGQA